jgi:hypothetical protein
MPRQVEVAVVKGSTVLALMSWTAPGLAGTRIAGCVRGKLTARARVPGGNQLRRDSHGEAGPSVPPGALAYSRSVYASALDWYKVADSKGQLLLTLNGAYITVLSSAAIAYSQEIRRTAGLPPAALVFLAGAAIATAVSILSAIACLHSLSDARLDKLRGLLTERDTSGAIRYRPAAMYWFGTIARIDRGIGLKMLESADEAFELAALSEEILLLAPNVLAKHRWANRGWAAAGMSLLLLLAAAVSAVIAA